MSSQRGEENPREGEGRWQEEPVPSSEALAASGHEAAVRNAVRLWAERNARPETLAHAEKLTDKGQAVNSFFDFAGKHPGEATPEDVSRWRSEMESRGLSPPPSTPASQESRPSIAGC